MLMRFRRRDLQARSDREVAVLKRVFIVRPFATQEGVNFDEVEAVLIRPAMKLVQSATLEGGTTLPFVEQGNIREDMFRELVMADLVIADLSIHNANVFYELGIRHGLRPNTTFMLRADVQKFPFDLQTDRYLKYDAKNPAASIAQLAEALEATLASDRVDSPVYQLLPGLPAPDATVLRVVPRDFGEAVDRARTSGLKGDLRLLAHESRGFPWATEGLRAVGRAQFNLKGMKGARETFEWIRELRPDDVEANQRLGTIYQRLAQDEPARRAEYLQVSSAAIQRVIDSPIPNSWHIAEAYALKARNIKTKWLERVHARTGTDAQIDALQAPELEQAAESYAAGFAQDLNHFYSGLNALALFRLRVDLARAHPDVWSAGFESDDEARLKLEASEARCQQLSAAVRLSIEATRLALGRHKTPDPDRKLWSGISAADLAFLTATRPKSVAQRYREALADAPSFAVDAVLTQTEIFRYVGVRTEFVVETLAVLAEIQAGTPSAAAVPRRLGRTLLFTGHMVDAQDRTTPRFPPTPEAEAEARRIIREAIQHERSLEDGALVGIAGGAAGGDILFHEICQELEIPTQLFLALPAADFSRESVQHGGPQWVERFQRLCQRVPPRVLSDTPLQPIWLRGKKEYGIWQRNNLWMLFNALALDAERLTLLALWDKGAADGPGGTEDLVTQVEQRGYKWERLPAERLKAFAPNSRP